MVSINYATREVSCKVVYYGPGLSGKTTNLQYVHQKVPPSTKGKLISLATDADRTLYFDFLPINIGAINGFAAKFQLYTVPGQVYYNATRKLVLRGVDGLVFVADSQPDKMDENIESLNNLKENLAEYGYKLDELPIVIQYNKQDLPNVLRPDQLRPVLNPRGWPEFGASATLGTGVFDTLKCILKLVLDKSKTGGTTTSPQRQTVSAPQSAMVEHETARPAEPVHTEIGRSQPVSEPALEPEVTPAAAMASEQPPDLVREPCLPTADSTDDDLSGPEDAGAPMKPQPEYVCQRDSVPPTAGSVGQGQPVKYRPFPGNTRDDEEQMRRQRPRDDIWQSRTPRPFGERSVPTSTTPAGAGGDYREITSTGQPRMAPSLRADKPRKKRSFFKRLFGLK